MKTEEQIREKLSHLEKFDTDNLPQKELDILSTPAVSLMAIWVLKWVLDETI